MTSEITPKKRRCPQHKRPRALLYSSYQREWWRLVLLSLLCGIWLSQRLSVIESSTRRHPAIQPPQQPYIIHPSSRHHFGHGRNNIHLNDEGSDTFNDLDNNNNNNDDDDDLLLLQQRDRIRIIPAAWILSSSSSSLSMASSQSTHHHHQRQRQPDMTDTNSNNNENENENASLRWEVEADDDGVSATTTSTSTMIQPPQMNIKDMANVLQFTSLLNAKIQQVCRNSSYSRTCGDTIVSVHHHHHHHHHQEVSHPTTTTTTFPHRMKWQQQPSPPPNPPVTLTRELSHRRVDELRGGGGGGGGAGVNIMSDRMTRDHEPYRIRNTIETTMETTTSSVEVPLEKAGTLSHSLSSSSSSLSYHRNHMAAAFHSYHQPMDDLHNYLLQIHHLLHLQQSDTPDTTNQNKNRNIDETTDSVATTASIALERTLMMLYLDRACSNNCCYHVKLPYCTPSTVHYLCVTAMLVAVGAVRGDMVSLLSSVSTTTTEYDDPTTATHDHNDSIVNRYNMILQQSSFMQSLFKKLEVHMGIPASDSQYRVSLMLQALAFGQGRSPYPGIDDDAEDEEYDDDEDDDDSGIFVTPSALQEWKEQWESRFDGRPNLEPHPIYSKGR